MFRIEYIGNTAAHSGSEVLARFSENDHASPGHIFAGMVSHTLHNRLDSGISNTETFSSLTTDIGRARGCAIKSYVTDDDIILWFKSCLLIWIHDQFSSGQTFTKIIISLSFQFKSYTRCNKCPETLSR